MGPRDAASPAASVLVAVRVRPFSEREKERNAQRVVRMSPDGRVTELCREPAGAAGQSRRFTFDHSYWSHDGFCPDSDGYLRPAQGSHYADQGRVFDDLGRHVLHNAWAGYNCTLFAYGQTGSGKSYSVVGFGANRGLVPMLCDGLFQGIQAERAKRPDADFQVSVSMLEIYSEKVRDLLGDKAAQLKVREHPQEGFYVEGLSSWPVNSYREVMRRIAEGTRMRTIAATASWGTITLLSTADTPMHSSLWQNMNETSSRAHTIVRLHFSQRSGKRSEINLVDLAGSERQKGVAPGANEEQRFREGIRINQSLSALGRVIKALHERQSRPGANGQVPYRDSVLTALLRNALGGNSKTIMLATVSPADLHFEETLSTLRFADRVKQIKTRPVVNEEEEAAPRQSETLVRTLRRENSRLLDTLRRGGLDGVASQQELESLRRQLAENQREVERLERNWLQRDETLRKQLSSISLPAPADEDDRRARLPHLWNLNEDPALTNVLVHFVDKGESRVGNGLAENPQILLKGLSIQPEHALLRNRDHKRVTIQPLQSAEILVNGRPIKGETELKQNDRVHFGGNHLYVFVNPHRKGALPVDKITFDMAQKEIARDGHLVVGGSAQKSKEELVLEEELLQLLPYVYRANSMAKELRKDCAFEIVLLPPESRGLTAGGPTEVWVKVHDRRQDSNFLWDADRFMSRYYAMQEMYQNWMETGGDRSAVVRSANQLPSQERKDPFYEQPNSPALLGTATVFLQNLAYLVELDERVPIVDVLGVETGQLSVSIRPCSTSGREIVGEYVEKTSQLVGKNLGIKLKLLSANGLPQKTDQSFCKYRFFDQEEVTTAIHSGSPNPVYTHERLFVFRPVTQQFLDYLMESALVIHVMTLGSQRRSMDAVTENDKHVKEYRGIANSSERTGERTERSTVASKATGRFINNAGTTRRRVDCESPTGIPRKAEIGTWKKRSAVD